MDFLDLTPVTKDETRYDNVLVIVSSNPMTNKGLTAQQFAEFLLERCVSLYGLPR